MAAASPNPDPVLADRLREALAAAGFDHANVRARVGEAGFAAQGSDAPLRAATLGDEPLDTLVRALFFEQPVAADDLRASLDPELLAQLGLAAVGDGVVSPLVRVQPQADVVVVADGYSRGADDPADYVAGVSGSAAFLAALTPRAHVARALDVGTGSGLQALLAAQHADEVVATDVNPRALAYTALNARLNGLDNVETRLGSLFEPVAGERFDLITCNAPFVVSPDSAFTYRDSGLPGDEFSEQLVLAAPAFLAAGGAAVLEVSWIVADEADWAARPTGWARAAGCDAWIVSGPRIDPVSHALAWNRHDLLRGDGSGVETAGRWLEYVRGLGAERLAEGVVFTRPAAGPEPAVFHDTVPGLPEPAPAHVERILAGQRIVATHDDGALLALPLRLAPEVLFEETFVLQDGRRRTHALRARLHGGLDFRAKTDPGLVELLGALDGSRSLRDAVRTVVERHGVADRTAEFEQQAAATARGMLAIGFLEARA